MSRGKGVIRRILECLAPRATRAKPDVPKCLARRAKSDVPKCSFCGKRHDEVNKLIAGPDVNICDECVGLCAEIVAEDRAHRAHRQDSTGETDAITPQK